MLFLSGSTSTVRQCPCLAKISEKVLGVTGKKQSVNVSYLAFFYETETLILPQCWLHWYYTLYLTMVKKKLMLSLKMCRPGTIRHQGLMEICHMQGKFTVSLHHESFLSRAAHTDANPRITFS